MRGIRGWIRNLADGEGPPVGSVTVSAIPKAKPPNFPQGTELGESEYRLGKLVVLHQPGSQDKNKADQLGHFGWDMELSPGPIDVHVTPHDPQTEFRHRFPDESAQVGKAFLTDLERLGWAGGRDGFVWDGIWGGYSTGSFGWSSDPSISCGLGNWAYGGGGTDDLAGRLFVRNGIAMLAGTIFSVELAQGIVVPVPGDPPMPMNSSTEDRWDLVMIRTDWNPGSPEYGKQSFEIIQGQTGQGFPVIPVNAGNFRRLPLYMVKMKSNTSVYDSSTGYDLRPWMTAPAGVAESVAANLVAGTQIVNASNNFQDSTANTNLAANEVILSPGVAWDGYIVFSCFPHSLDPTTELYVYITSEGRSVQGGTVAANSNYVIMPQNTTGNHTYQLTKPNAGNASYGTTHQLVTAVLPLRRIPSSQNALTTTTTRSWHRLRFKVQYLLAGGSCRVEEVNLQYHIWPVIY